MIAQQKIIIVTPWFGKFAGGAESLTKGMAIGLNKRGVKTIVFTTCCSSPYSNWWENNFAEGPDQAYGVKIYRFPVNSGTEIRKKYEESVAKFVHGRDMSEQDEINFFECGINSNKLCSTLGEYIDNGYTILSLPYYQGLTHSVINTYPEHVSLIPCFHNEQPFYWSPVYRLLKNAKNIFYNAYEEKQLTIQNYGISVGKKVVEGIVAGVAVEKKRETKKTVLNMAEYKYFVYMGRKEKGKNVHLLVDWFEKAKKKLLVDSHLVFIGGGDVNLIPKDNSYIHDFGFVSEADKENLLSSAIGLINLSVKESFSIVIMEAWLNSIPIVVHGKCEVTRGHAVRSNGGLFPENFDEFCQCLKLLESDTNLARALGENGKKYVRKNFSYDTVLEKYISRMELM